MTHPLDRLPAIVLGLHVIAFAQLFDQLDSIGCQDARAGGEADHSPLMFRVALRDSVGKGGVDDPEIPVAGRHCVEKHQQRRFARAGLDQGDGIGAFAVGEHETFVRDRVVNRDCAKIDGVVDGRTDKAPHHTGGPFAPLCFTFRIVQSQQIVGTVHANGVTFPTPCHTDLQEIDRGCPKRVYSCLRPGDDERAIESRSHKPVCLLFSFIFIFSVPSVEHVCRQKCAGLPCDGKLI